MSGGCPARPTCRLHLPDDFVLCALLAGAEQPGCGILGGGFAVLELTPVGAGGQQDPDGLAECAGQMGNGGIDRDDLIAGLQNGGSVGEIL